MNKLYTSQQVTKHCRANSIIYYGTGTDFVYFYGAQSSTHTHKGKTYILEEKFK